MEIGWMMESGTLLNIRGTQKKKYKQNNELSKEILVNFLAS